MKHSYTTYFLKLKTVFLKFLVFILSFSTTNILIGSSIIEKCYSDLNEKEMNMFRNLAYGYIRSFTVVMNNKESFRVKFINPKNIKLNSIVSEDDNVTQIDECQFKDMIGINHYYPQENKISKLIMVSMLPKNKLKGRVKKIFLKKNGKVIELNIDK